METDRCSWRLLTVPQQDKPRRIWQLLQVHRVLGVGGTGYGGTGVPGYGGTGARVDSLVSTLDRNLVHTLVCTSVCTLRDPSTFPVPM